MSFWLHINVGIWSGEEPGETPSSGTQTKQQQTEIVSILTGLIWCVLVPYCVFVSTELFWIRQEFVQSHKHGLHQLWELLLLPALTRPCAPTCSRALDTQVCSSSSRRDLWYFLVVFTARKMSFDSRGSLDLKTTPLTPGREPSAGPLCETVPLLVFGRSLCPVIGAWPPSLLVWVSLGLPCPTELTLFPRASPSSWRGTTRPPGLRGVLAGRLPTRAGLGWGRGGGRSTWWGVGWKAGMRSSRKPQNASDNRKHSLLEPTEARCILIGQWRAYQPPAPASLSALQRPIFMTSDRKWKWHHLKDIIYD